MKTDRRQLWLGLALAIAAIVLCETRCKGGVVTESFLQRVALRESGNNPLARGKAGERGPFQMLPAAVRDVQDYFNWPRHTFHQATTIYSTQYARGFLIMQESRLRKHYGRQPTEVEVYRAYNRGFAGSIRK